MSESATQIELMQQRLEAIAAREQALIDALNDALMSADRKLLDEVRSVTADHEARRTLILSELQTLAGRIGAFPITAQSVDAIEHDVPTAPLAASDAAPQEPEATPQGGDWRKAAKKITEELEFHFNGTRSPYSTN